MAERFEFEGRPVPAGPALRAALRGDPDTRAWVVRAAVAHPGFAQTVLDTAEAMLVDPASDAAARAAALHAFRALSARSRVGAVCAAFADHPDRFVGVEDPIEPRAPGRTLARLVVAFVSEAAPRTHLEARGLLRSALAIPEVRLEAWRALAPDDGEGPLPHLADLLRQAPDLAGPVATQYALVHTPLCEDAARAVADLPEAPRRAFADALQKHLLRIHAVKRWVVCRRILFGK